MKRTLLLALLAAPLWAQDIKELQYTPTVFGGTPNFNWGSRQKLYRASQVVFVASQAADLASCWYNCPESNKLLSSNGYMRGRGIAIKTGFTIGFLVLERLAVRKWPRTKPVWTGINFVIGASHTGVAIRNVSK